MRTHTLRKRWEPLPFDPARVDALQKALGIRRVFCRLLVQRGIHTFEEARFFFRPSLSDLHDPFLMKDMDRAVERLTRAIEAGEKILLYGDYDVDGTTAVAMMYAFLEDLYPQFDYYLPDRKSEGYGISEKGVQFARQNGFSLVIALDCGIRAVDKIREAARHGIDFIVCDHHLPKAVLPPAAAVLDPKRADCPYPFKELTGCGVAFKLLQAFSRRHHLSEANVFALLDLVALSIASDIVPIVGENRILAKFGLEQLNRTKRPGLQALMLESRRSRPFSISDIVFGLAPMINAAGRLSSAEWAVKLMVSRHPYVGREYARMLYYRNQLRKDEDQATTYEAQKMIAELPDWQERKSLVVFQGHWHPGVLGIVAARLAEIYHRPAIVFTQVENGLVGSARSIPGFDLHEALNDCRRFFDSFGGHHHAAGIRMKKEWLGAFREAFEVSCRRRWNPAFDLPVIPIAAELRLRDIDLKFWNILRQFAPFGPGNRNPIFLSRGVRDSGRSRLVKKDHLMLSVIQEGEDRIGGIAFGMGHLLEKVKSGRPFDICYRLEQRVWRGKPELRMLVNDLDFHN